MEARIRIKNGAREFEVEGTADFVGTMIDRLPQLFGELGQSDEGTDEPEVDLDDTAQETAKPGKGQEKPKAQAANGLPDNFGEYLNQFRKNIDQNEEMLIAGYFVQSGSADKSFSTSEANNLLKDQGIKVGNPSQSNTNNMKAKRIFGAAKGRFRVSQDGVNHIATLRN